MPKRNLIIKKTVERFYNEGRGQGTGADYNAWYQVRRFELFTHGLASIRPTQHGPQHCLSTVEKVASLCASLTPEFYETREQFPLLLEPGPHELCAYTGKYEEFCPGTKEIAKELGVPHRKTPGPYTTDLLTTYKSNSSYELLAVACKGSGKLSDRDIELLHVEKVYWNKRNTPWILFDPSLYTRAFANIVLGFAPIVLKRNVPLDIDLTLSIRERINQHSYSYTDLFKHFTKLGYEAGIFQKAFWHGYFTGVIPMEVNVIFNCMKEIKLIDRKKFLDQNPIVNRRSAWKF